MSKKKSPTPLQMTQHCLKRDGNEVIAKKLGLNKMTVLRYVTGQPCHAGTVLLIETRIAELYKEAPKK